MLSSHLRPPFIGGVYFMNIVTKGDGDTKVFHLFFVPAEELKPKD